MGVDNDLILCECVRVPLSSVCHDLEAWLTRPPLCWTAHGRPKTAKRSHPRAAQRTGYATEHGHRGGGESASGAGAALHSGPIRQPLLGVDAIVAATDLSRRPLEKAFRQELNRTLNEEIVRVRMEKVKDLLTTTKMKVVEVAAATGFARPSHLFRTFRKLVGISPRTYRKREALKTQPPALSRPHKQT